MPSMTNRLRETLVALKCARELHWQYSSVVGVGIDPTRGFQLGEVVEMLEKELDSILVQIVGRSPQPNYRDGQGLLPGEPLSSQTFGERNYDFP